MMQKLRAAIRKIATLPSRDDGALSMLQLVTLVIGPIVAGSLALGVVSTVRLGGDLTTVFNRDAAMNQMVERMQLQLSNVTELDVTDEHSFTARDQPTRRSAYYVPANSMPTVCVSNTWSLIESGVTRTLVNVQKTHEADSCDSPVKSEKEWSLGGFDPDTAFTYENAYGRDLTFADGSEAGSRTSVNIRPDELFNNEWEYASPGFVTIIGTLNQAIGTTAVDTTAKTPLKQLRPGVVSSDLGELGPPIIERTARGGDVFRASFSALTVLNDPRTTIEWSWREVKNGGSTPTDRPAESAWGAWKAWTTLDHFDSTVLQGGKWQVQAKYRVVLEEDTAESETVTMTWVRPIDKPAPPTATIALNTTTREATITIAPAACAPGTSANTQSRYLTNDSAWSAYVYRAAAPHTQKVTVPEGARITAMGQARCASPFAESVWVSSAGANPTAIAPITTRPTIEAVFANIPVPEDRGTIQAQLSGCPAGTTYQARWHYSVNEAANVTIGGFVAVGTRPSVDAANVREGEQFVGGVTAKCVTPHYTASPTATGDSDPEVNPIRKRPNVTGVTSAVNTSTGATTISGLIDNCQPWMTYQARPGVMTGEATTFTYGAFAAVSGGQTSLNPTTTVAQGDRFRGALSARCATKYAVGGSVEAASSGWEIRPISTPAAPTMQAWINTDAGRVNYASSNLVPPANACPAGTTLDYQQRRMIRQNSSTGTWGSMTSAQAVHAAVAQGTRMDAEGQIRCESRYTASSWSVMASAYTVRPITTTPDTPTMQAWINTDAGRLNWGSSNIVPPSSTCDDGTLLEYNHRRMVRAGMESGSWEAWRTNKDIHEAITEGARLNAEGRLRCTTLYADGPFSGTASNYVVRSITTSPDVTNPNALIYKSTSMGRAAADVSGCPSGTVYSYRGMERTNAETSWTYYSWNTETSSGRFAFDPTTTYGEGTRFLGGIQSRCITQWTQGPAASDYFGWVVRPIDTIPNVTTPGAAFSGDTGRMAANVWGCPSSTSYEWRGLLKEDDQDDWSYASWNQQKSQERMTYTSNRSFNQGAKLQGGIQARCISDYDTGKADHAVDIAYREITTDAKATAQISRSDGSISVNVTNTTDCPTGTTFRWRFRDRENSGDWSAYLPTTSTSSGADGTGKWLRYNAGWQYARTIGYGDNATVDVHVVCRSNYVNGTGSHDSATSSTRPYPAPAAPSGAWALNGGVSRSCSNDWFGVSFGWGSSSYTNYYQYYVSWNSASGGRASSGYYTTSGTSGSFSYSGSHSSSVGAVLYVRAVGSGGTSGWRSEGLEQGTGCTRG